MIDFSGLNVAEKELYRLKNKGKKFLSLMVKTVFFSTFIFTVYMGGISYLKDWEQLAITLTDNWFKIMVGELIVAGVIQIVKEVVGGRDNG